MRVIDLFAGPGGWDVGARTVGLDPLGIEFDATACETRKAAGLRTLHADVSALNPLDFAPCDGLIASPPCQAWSVAGKRGAAKDIDLCVRTAAELAAGNDTRAEHRRECEDERSILVVEPLRWAIALKPRWLAFEQVPPVLGFWTLIASLLEQHGYRCWAGILEAERYGVPQTRERAILMASRDGQPHPPRPTHQRYIYGEPARHDVTFDGEVLPWVSMAEALGWGLTERPCLTVPADMHSGWVEGGSGSRATVEREVGRGAWSVKTGNFTARDHRGQRGVPYERPVTDPAPTVTGTVNRWVFERPSTTIACDSRVFQPGGHHEPGKQSENAIVVTPAEALVLQGFPSDYPVQGTTKEAVFRQIGNAVPPPLAAAVLGEFVDDQMEAAA